jgi:hypothetical protein
VVEAAAAAAAAGAAGAPTAVVAGVAVAETQTISQSVVAAVRQV